MNAMMNITTQENLLSNMEKSIMESRNTAQAIVNFQSNNAASLTPREIMTKRPTPKLFMSLLMWGAPTAYAWNIPASNSMLLDQIGRAIALSQSFEMVCYFNDMEPLGEEYPLFNSSEENKYTKEGVIMRHIITGQIYAATIAVKTSMGKVLEIPEVYNLDTFGKRWEFHLITESVRGGRLGMEGAITFNRRNKEFCPPYTKYHFLGAWMLGRKVNVKATPMEWSFMAQTAWYRQIIKAFRNEFWSHICGYSHKRVTQFAAVYNELMEMKMKGGK